jgi:hypothetical protein
VLDGLLGRLDGTCQPCGTLHLGQNRMAHAWRRLGCVGRGGQGGLGGSRGCGLRRLRASRDGRQQQGGQHEAEAARTVTLRHSLTACPKLRG